MNRVNIFENRKTEKRFAELSSYLIGEKKNKFTKRVKALFTDKVLSSDGEYTVFKITIMDLNGVFANLKK